MIDFFLRFFVISARILICLDEKVTYLVFISPTIKRLYKNPTIAVAAVRFAVTDCGADAVLSKHGDWVAELKTRHSFTEENAMDILLQETGRVFAGVLEDAGVYKNTPEGAAAFSRFVDRVNEEVSV